MQLKSTSNFNSRSERPTLSVCLCACNEQEHLPEQLKAILSQGRQHDELILLDDGSTDATSELLREVQKITDKVTLIRRDKPSGPVAAYNFVASEATCDWLYLPSGNDLVHPGAFQAWELAVQKWPHAKLIAGDIVGEVLEWADDECFLDPKRMSAAVKRGVLFFGASVFVRRDIWNLFGGLRENLRWYSDWFLYHAIALRHGAVYLAKTIALFRRLPNSYCSGHKDPELARETAKEVKRLLLSEECRDIADAMLAARGVGDLIATADGRNIALPKSTRPTVLDVGERRLMRPRFVYITAVWGQEFTDTWLKTCLPLQRYALEFASRPEDVFAVLTPHFRSISSIHGVIGPIMNVDIHQAEFSGNSHERLAKYHALAIEKYGGRNQVLVFLSPDVVYARGAFSYMRRQIELGYRAVVVPMYRASRQGMLRGLTIREDGIAARDLVRASMACLHPLTRGLFWNGQTFHEGWPSHVYFPAPGGLVGHCWHLHPLAVALDAPISQSRTIDADLIVNAGIRPEEICVTADSDDFCAVEMTDLHDRIPERGTPKNPWAIAKWALHNTTELDRIFFQRRVIWHSHDIDQSWAAALAEADFATDEVLRRMAPFLKEIK